jgi:hypothetical protein
VFDAGAVVGNAHLVTDHFGHWPQFHDAEVLSVALDRLDRTATIELRAFGTTDAVAPDGTFERTKECTVAFRFVGVGDLELFDFNEQNVLWSLVMDKLESRVVVELHQSYGLGGRFTCDTVEVRSLQRGSS